MAIDTQADSEVREGDVVADEVQESTIVATDVSLEDYMERYTDYGEWLEGAVIRVAPSEFKHMTLIKYLTHLIDAFFAFRPIGILYAQPFVMRLPAFPKRRREPDLFIVLNTNTHERKDTYMDGPADICIEIVSEESAVRDHGDKFVEYEKGGVPEYWIIDPLRTETRFYRLNSAGRYSRQNEDADGNYYTPALPSFALHVATLWQEPLPNYAEIYEAVKTMLEQR